MKKLRRPVLAVAVAAALVAALSAALAVRSASADNPVTFTATLTAAEETPPTPSTATGSAIVTFNGDSISYELRVNGLSNIVAGHIHVGAPGVAGPVVLTLITPTPLLGPFNGILAARTITNPQLEGPLAGQPLSALLSAVQAGNAYVNVHTNDGVAPPNTGPGDFPGGEIRGQLHAASSDVGGVEKGRSRGRGR
jgi:CHRD domain